MDHPLVIPNRFTRFWSSRPRTKSTRRPHIHRWCHRSWTTRITFLWGIPGSILVLPRPILPPFQPASTDDGSAFDSAKVLPSPITLQILRGLSPCLVCCICKNLCSNSVLAESIELVSSNHPDLDEESLFSANPDPLCDPDMGPSLRMKSSICFSESLVVCNSLLSFCDGIP